MATLTMKWYANGLEKVTKGTLDFLADNIKCALVTATYVPDQSLDEFWSTPQTNEATGTGYTAGGQLLATKTHTQSGLVVTLDAADVSWDPSSITARYVVLYKDDGVAATSSPLLAYGDAGASQTSDGAAFTVSWNASGILTATAS